MPGIGGKNSTLNPGDPVFNGTSGPDSFVAPAGNSGINGLSGNDTVTFGFSLVSSVVSYSGPLVLINTASSHTELTGIETYIFTDGAVNERDGNGLVADLFYYSQYHDVWNAHIEPDAHYTLYGWREHRNPSAFFDTDLYLSLHQDVRASGVNPLTHFDTAGWKLGYQPSATFDVQKYLAANLDVAAANVDPLEHFLSHGYEEGRVPFAVTSITNAVGFDALYYLQTYGDVKAAQVDPYQHYLTSGWHEGRNPNAYFDTLGYLATYTDVAAAGVNPLIHFDQYGWREGRISSPAFDPAQYLAAYTDVAAAGVDPLQHYLSHGIDEGRLAFAKPVFDTNGAANTVLEGAAAGTNTGLSVSWGGWVSPALSFSLGSDSSGGGFTINNLTGQVTVADSSKLDFETSGASHSYVISVVAHDGALSSSQSFTINIGDIAPTGPVDTNGAINAVAEGAGAGTAVGITLFSAEPNGPPVAYSLTDNAGGRFAIDPNTGVVTVANSALIDFETSGGSHQYTITGRTTSGAVVTATQNFVIAVIDAPPSTPADVNGSVNGVAEGSATGTLVGITASSSDPNGPAPTYSLTDSAGGRFAIDSTTGIVTIGPNANLVDFESSGGGYNITVGATVGAQSSSRTFAVAVGDVAPSQPADSNGGADTVAEGATTNTPVGVTAASSDPNGGTVIYSLTNDAGGRFQINSSTGVVSVSALGATTIDFESGGASHSYTITAQASDGTLASSQTFSIAVTNIAPSTPVDADSASANGVAEGVGAGLYIGLTAASSDPNSASTTVAYTLTDSAGGRFAIDSSTGVVTTGANANLIDFETSGGSYNITVQASDGQGGTSTQSFAIAVANANPSTPADGDGVNADVINEGAPNGTYVGLTVQAADPGSPATTLSYSLTDTAGGRFTINATSGAVTVANGSLIDFESATGHAYSITAQASDGAGGARSQTFAIAVADVNDNAPIFTSTAAPSLPENTKTVVALATTDADTVGTNPPAFSVSGGADAAFFQIGADGHTLEFKVAPNFEAPGSAASSNVYSVNVSAFDGANTTVQSITVTVTDQNDNAPAFVSGVTGGEAENTSTANVVYDANATDADGTAANNTIVFSLSSGGDNDLFIIDSSTGFVTFRPFPSLPPDFESPADADHNNAYQITVHANDGGFDVTRNVTITITDDNDNAPVFQFALTSITPPFTGSSTPENAAYSFDAHATDADATAPHNSIAYSLTGPDSGLLSISASGVVTFNAPNAPPNFEAFADANGDNVFEVTVHAIDNGVHDVTRDLRITVTDTNDNTPVFGPGATGSEPENTPATNIVYTAQASDADASAAFKTIQFSLQSGVGDNNLFNIDGATGEVRFNAAPDFEAAHGPTYNIVVTASDGTNSATKSVTISVTDLNDNAPVFDSAATTDSTAENNGSYSFNAHATDADVSNTITYSLTGDDAADFAISSAGVLTFNATPDFEAPADLNLDNVYKVTVHAIDNGGAHDTTRDLEITVADAADVAPGFTSGTTGSEAEGTASTNVVYTAATSPSAGVTFTLPVGLFDNALFAIDSNDGELRFLTSPNFEAHPAAYHVVVQANAAGFNPQQDVFITVTDVAPVIDAVDGNAAADIVAEGALEGVDAGIKVVASDFGADTVNFTLSNSAGGRFKIDPDGTVSTGANAALINYETSGATHSYTITVVASTSGGTATSSKTYDIAVGDVTPGALTDSDISTNRIAQAAADGTPVGITYFASDPNGGPLTYTLTDDDSGNFVIDATTGVVTLKTGHAALGVVGTVHSIAATAFDGVYTVGPISFNIVVANDFPTVDLNGPSAGLDFSTSFTEISAGSGPVAIAAATATITDPVATQLVSATITLTNAQAGDTLTLASTPGGIAQQTVVDAGTITIKLTGAASLAAYTTAIKDIRFDSTSENPNTAPRVISVVGNDGTNDSNIAQTTITVAAVNDAPVFTSVPAGVSYNENATATALFAGAVVTDPDSPLNFSSVDPGVIPGGSFKVQITANADTFDQIVLLGAAPFSVSGTDLLQSGHVIGTISGLGTALVQVTELTSFATPAVANQLIHAFGFSNSSDNPAAAPDRTVTFTFTDGGNTGTPGAQSASTTQTVHVNVSNDAPVNTVPAAIAVTEDVASPLTGISVADDSGANNITMTLSVPAGSLAALSGGGVAVGGNASAMTLSGTASAINAFIAASNVTFTTASNSTTNVTLTVSVDDGGNTGGGALTDSDTVTLAVTAVNDAPTAVDDGPLSSIAEDSGTRVISIASLTGNDTRGPATATDEGGQHLTITLGNISNVFGGTVQIVGTDILFTPDADFNGTASFKYRVTDDGTPPQTSDVLSPATVSFAVTAVNDAPDGSVPSPQTAIKNTVLNVDPIQISDLADGSSATDYTVELSVLNGTLDVGDASGSGGVPLANIATTNAGRTVTLTGSIAQINISLGATNNVHYTPDLNYLGPDTLTVVTNDQGNTGGGDLIDTDTVAITVNPPILLDLDANNSTAFGTTYSALEPTPAVAIAVTDTDTTITDPTNANITSATLTISGNFQAGDVLNFTNTATITGVFAGGALTLTGSDTAANYEIALESVTYTTSSLNTGNRVIDIVVNSAAATSNTAISTVYFHTLDLNGPGGAGNAGTGFSATFTEGLPAAIVPVAIADTDIDINGFGLATLSATVTITNYVASQDFLSFTNTADIQGNFVAGTLTLTAIGLATPQEADYEAALKTVKYSNTSNDPNITHRDITVVVTDGVSSSNVAHTSIHVAETNDAPQATDDPLSSIAEDSGSRVISFASLLSNDFTGTGFNETGQLLTITNVTGAVGGSVTIVGTDVIFTPDANFSGAASFDYTIEDDGTDDGFTNSLTDLGHVTFTVNAANDAPVIDLLAAAGVQTTGTTATFTETSPAVTPVVIAPAVTLLDDGANLTQVVLTQANFKTDDILKVSGLGTVSGDVLNIHFDIDNLNHKVTLTPVVAPATVAEFQAGLRLVQFDNAGENPDTTPRTFTIDANDGALVGTATATVNFTATNDAPALDLDLNNNHDLSLTSAFTTSYTVSTAAVPVVDTDVTITDVDNTNAASATVILTKDDAAHPGDTLTVQGALPGGITANISENATTITVTLSGVASFAAYQTALRQVVFANGTDPSPLNSSRTIDIAVRDQGNQVSNTAQTTITVLHNTAPTAGAESLAATEKGGANNSTGGSNPAPGSVLGNDTDTETPTGLTVVSFGAGTTATPGAAGTLGLPLHGLYGVLTLNADGSYAYALDNSNTTVQALRAASPLLDDEYHYTIQDAGGLPASANFVVHITGADDLPLAVADLGTMNEESAPTNFLVRANDSLDPDTGAANTLTLGPAGVTVTSGASNLTTPFQNSDASAAIVVPGGIQQVQVTLTNSAFQQLKAGETATVTVPYSLAGNGAETSTANLVVTVNGVTDLPVARDDHPAAITEDANLAARTFAVLTDLDGVGSDLADTLDADHADTGSTTHNKIVTGSVTVLPSTPGGLGIDAGDVGVATDATDTQIVVTLGADFQKLQVGQTAAVDIHYTLQGNAGELSGADLHLLVNGVNDAPVVTAGAAGSFTENASAAAVVPNLTLTDVDNTALTTAKVALTNFKTGDVLSVNGLGTTSGDLGNIHFDINNSTHEVTLTALGGTETVGNYQSALRLVQFSNPSDALDATTRTFTVTATDTGDGVNAPSQVTGTSGVVNFTVIAVNDAPVNTVPTPAGSHFYADSNTATTISGFQIADVDANPDNVQVTLGTNHGGLVTVASVAGGAPTITGNGTASVILTGTVAQINTTLANAGTGITYQSAAAFNGLDPTPANNIETLQITTNDLGHNPSGALTDQDSIQIGVLPKVWYIDNTPPGSPTGPLGSINNPFTTLAAFTAVNDGGAGHPAAGDTVFVRSGTYDAAHGDANGITLLNNQKLIGEGDGLAFQDPFAAAGTNIQVVAAGARPVISVGGSGIGIDLASGNNVHGLDVATTAAGAVGIDDGAANNSVGSLSIANMQITGSGKAVDIDHGGALSVTLDKLTSLGSSSEGIDLGGNVTGTFTVNNNTSTILGATGTDFNISTNGLLTVTYNGDITQNSNAALVSVSGGHTGTITFQNGTLTGADGTGLQFDNADGTYNFNGTNTLNNSDGVATSNAGININNGSNGNFSFSSNSSIINQTTGTAFNLNGGAGTVTYAGTIGTIDPTTDNSGSTSVSVTNRTGGSVTFSGNILDSSDTNGGIGISGNSAGTIDFTANNKTLNTGIGDAVSLNANTGATINFSNGGLDIDTTNGTGFSATAGGTVTVTGNSNTIDATSGPGLNISNTNIGSGNVTFQRISSGGGANDGILLDHTGTAAGNGGLHVTGVGTTAATGGTIANKTGVDGSTTSGIGIYLNTTKDVQLKDMQLNGFQNFGIYGTSVTGFSLDHSVINGVNGNNAGFDEGSMIFDGLFGTATVTANSISGGVEDNLRVRNSSGTLDITIGGAGNGNTFTGAAGGNDNISLEPSGTATVTAHIQNNTFTGSSGDHVQLTTSNSATGTWVVTNNTMTNALAGSLLGGITISGGNLGSSEHVNFNVSSNNVTGTVQGGAININEGQGGGTWQGQVSNNTVGNVAVANSGASQSSGIRVENHSTSGTLTALVSGNNVSQWNNGAAINLQAGDAGNATNTGVLNATVINNTISNPGAASQHGIVFNIGAGSGSGAADNHAFIDVHGNSINLGGVPPNGGFLIRLRQREASDVRVTQTQATTGSVAAELDDANGFNDNPAGSKLSVSVSGLAGSSLLYNQGTPPQPTVPTLVAKNGQGPGGGSSLTLGLLAPVVAAAIDHWAAAGATADQLAQLNNLGVFIDDLPDNGTLGQTFGPSITLDVNGGGWGWFIDATPGENSEFKATHSSTEFAATAGDAAGRIDLLTVIEHELGHAIGLDHTDVAGDVMGDTLDVGVRRLPSGEDVAHIEQPAPAAIAQAAEDTLPAGAAAPSGTPIVAGTQGSDTIVIDQGGTIVVGGAGGDTFVFGQATVDSAAPVTHIADYSAMQGDTFDFSALRLADAAQVRVVEDASDAFAMLQVDVGSDAGRGVPAAAHWVSVAQLDGIHAGDAIDVWLNPAQAAHLHAGLLA